MVWERFIWVSIGRYFLGIKVIIVSVLLLELKIRKYYFYYRKVSFF